MHLGGPRDGWEKQNNKKKHCELNFANDVCLEFPEPETETASEEQRNDSFQEKKSNSIKRLKVMWIGLVAYRKRSLTMVTQIRILNGMQLSKQGMKRWGSFKEWEELH
ncbi:MULTISPECIES: hypothetical protein [Paenibacillus]|uniref:Uncharacterized protein n=1 Tax=Paenibacillus albilobatus TaxID=2716884 RepID=A0A920CAI3_9BACL|nr:MULTISPECIES: hypothetical protein [Paenibacillus]GIO32456.1 hypothetical protein J2TS6_35970 [Paenibacillus albilobatus]